MINNKKHIFPNNIQEIGADKMPVENLNTVNKMADGGNIYNYAIGDKGKYQTRSGMIEVEITNVTDKGWVIFKDDKGTRKDAKIDVFASKFVTTMPKNLYAIPPSTKPNSQLLQKGGTYSFDDYFITEYNVYQWLKQKGNNFTVYDTDNTGYYVEEENYLQNGYWYVLNENMQKVFKDTAKGWRVGDVIPPEYIDFTDKDTQFLTPQKIYQIINNNNNNYTFILNEEDVDYITSPNTAIDYSRVEAKDSWWDIGDIIPRDYISKTVSSISNSGCVVEAIVVQDARIFEYLVRDLGDDTTKSLSAKRVRYPNKPNPAIITVNQSTSPATTQTNTSKNKTNNLSDTKGWQVGDIIPLDRLDVQKSPSLRNALTEPQKIYAIEYLGGNSFMFKTETEDYPGNTYWEVDVGYVLPKLQTSNTLNDTKGWEVGDIIPLDKFNFKKNNTLKNDVTAPQKIYKIDKRKGGTVYFRTETENYSGGLYWEIDIENFLPKSQNDFKVGDKGFYQTRSGNIEVTINSITKAGWVIFNDTSGKRKDAKIDDFRKKFTLIPSTTAPTTASTVSQNINPDLYDYSPGFLFPFEYIKDDAILYMHSNFAETTKGQIANWLNSQGFNISLTEVGIKDNTGYFGEPAYSIYFKYGTQLKEDSNYILLLVKDVESTFQFAPQPVQPILPPQPEPREVFDLTSAMSNFSNIYFENEPFVERTSKDILKDAVGSLKVLIENETSDLEKNLSNELNEVIKNID
jgi:hypothetical protein